MDDPFCTVLDEVIFFFICIFYWSSPGWVIALLWSMYLLFFMWVVRSGGACQRLYCWFGRVPLFVTMVPLHGSVARITLRQWFVRVLKGAGIYGSLGIAHVAVASTAVVSGVLVNMIMQAADWVSVQTFCDNYLCVIPPSTLSQCLVTFFTFHLFSVGHGFVDKCSFMAQVLEMLLSLDLLFPSCLSLAVNKPHQWMCSFSEDFGMIFSPYLLLIVFQHSPILWYFAQLKMITFCSIMLWQFLFFTWKYLSTFEMIIPKVYRAHCAVGIWFWDSLSFWVLLLPEGVFFPFNFLYRNAMLQL